jgi:hypothetical protein
VSPARPVALPGDGMLHPLALGAVAVLVLNDHWGKAVAPGLLTGKLSDVAGLLFFPLFLQALWEVGCAAARRPRPPSLRALGLAVAATALVFTLVKVWPPAGAAYRHGLALLQWPPRALAAQLSAGPLPRLAPVALAQDVTDLLALPALALSFAAGRARARGPAADSGQHPCEGARCFGRGL